MQLPDYDLLTDLISRSDLPFMPAELHGIATGLLIVDAATPTQRYQQLVMTEPDTGDGPAMESLAQLQTLFETTRNLLQTPTLDFDLLLPDEAETLELRIDSACEWARGCLYGLMEQGLMPEDDISEDVSGFISDLIQISQGGYHVNESEDAELVYADLLEYLRMGVLMTQEELQPIKAAPQQQLH